MAVSDTTGSKDAVSPSVGDAEVDTSFTPIYRLLRALVHGLNRLLFRTKVRERSGCPPRDR